MKIAEGLKYLTPDTVAECLSGISPQLYTKLWNVSNDLEKSGKAVPLGGDGSNGTIEVPPEPDAYMSGKMASVWHLFSEDEQLEMNTAQENEEKSYERFRSNE